MRVEFDNQFTRRGKGHVKSRPGNPDVQEYRAVYDAQGVLRLEPSGVHDLYGEIQSYAASTDLSVIINRYFNGDPGALSKVQGFYGDISGMPTSIHEAYNLMERAKVDFHRLPVEIQSKFDNNPMQFLSSLGTPEWADKMGLVAAAAPPAKDVVKDAVDNAAVQRDMEV